MPDITQIIQTEKLNDYRLKTLESDLNSINKKVDDVHNDIAEKVDTFIVAQQEIIKIGERMETIQKEQVNLKKSEIELNTKLTELIDKVDKRVDQAESWIDKAGGNIHALTIVGGLVQIFVFGAMSWTFNSIIELKEHMVSLKQELVYMQKEIDYYNRASNKEKYKLK
jgi:hypothetical protein